MQSMLSLAKLASFVAADENLTTQIDKIDADLNVVEYQEQLSENLMAFFGYDIENQKVLRVEELINVSIRDITKINKTNLLKRFWCSTEKD